MKKVLSAIITIVMVVSLSTVAFAAESYEIWVDSVEVTSSNADDVLGDSTVSYDADSNILTLNGATLDEYYDSESTNSSAALFTENDLNVELIGTNTIAVTLENAPREIANYGVYSLAGLKIFGEGTLNVSAPSYGVYATTGLRIEDCTVNASAPIFAVFSINGELGIFNSKVNAYASDGDGYAIGCFNGSIAIDNSDVFAFANYAVIAQNGGQIAVTDSLVVAVGDNRAMYFKNIDLKTSQNRGMYIRASADRFGLVGTRVLFNNYDILGTHTTRFAYINLRKSTTMGNLITLISSQIKAVKAVIA